MRASAPGCVIGASPLTEGFDNPGGADVVGRVRRPVRPRHAASLLLWREGPDGPELLMGRRHPSLRFMPDVMVFPGGRVDPADARAPALTELRPETLHGLTRVGTPGIGRACAIAAARELQEETGLVLGEMRGPHVLPDLAVLDYLCRAVTPADRPMRFNARFLIAPAQAAHGKIHGSGELGEIDFYSVEAAKRARMARITAMIMEEFLAWHALTPGKRAKRDLIRFVGRDSRRVER